MFNVDKNNVIRLTRGDTAVINLSLKMNGEDYVLNECDACVLTVKKRVVDEEVLLQKQLINGQFIIEPTDTSALPYGTYKYDVQLTTTEGVVNTVITPKDFVIDAEVTW